MFNICKTRLYSVLLIIRFQVYWHIFNFWNGRKYVFISSKGIRIFFSVVGCDANYWPLPNWLVHKLLLCKCIKLIRHLRKLKQLTTGDLEKCTPIKEDFCGADHYKSFGYVLPLNIFDTFNAICFHDKKSRLLQGIFATFI